MTAHRDRLHTLCEEYLSYVKAQRDGTHSAADVHAIGGQRSLVHDELCRMLHVDRSVDMPTMAIYVLGMRMVNAEARASSLFREMIAECRRLGLDSETVARLFTDEIGRE